MTFRASRAIAVAALLAAIGPGCARRPPERDDLSERIDAALAHAQGFLLSQQSPDGAWRSRTYGAMRDGPSLTPAACKFLAFHPSLDESGAAALARGRDYIARMLRPDGSSEPDGGALLYPVYTAALSAIVLGQSAEPEHARASRSWLTLLREHRYGPHLGWRRADATYGGWGYAPRPFPKDAAREGFEGEANLSSTLFAVGALRMSGLGADDPVCRDALAFACRCQNFAEAPALGDPAFDDGGFFFSPADTLRNKTGAVRDRDGQERFPSYGSMTADGIRLLLRCGLPPDHPRVRAASSWLQAHFDPAHVPGRFAPDREFLRDATYYYYAWSCAHAFATLNLRTCDVADRRVDWAAALASELLSRQCEDGSWASPLGDSKEDDPLVATPLAAGALALCARQMDTSAAR
ncbi:MAG: hypothetical protein HY608_07565 [Planctomycetes bacterium]|nr:hypothetical protein [Planctomycetota bacterium]